MPMDEKQRLIWDKTFMAFGSMMKAMDSTRLNEEKFMLFAEEAWKWSVKQVSELVDQLYNGTLPEIPADEQNGTATTSSPPPTASAPPEKKTDGMISEAQQRRLFAISKNAGVTNAQLKALRIGIRNAFFLPCAAAA